MSQHLSHEYYMSRALRLARQGRYTAHPNPRVGCVIVKDGKIVGEGWHIRAGGPHAEVHALRMAGDQAKGATAYVTLEPCSHHGRTPPCCEALIKAQVAKVVVAIEDPNPKVSGSGHDKLRAAGIEVEVGFLTAEAAEINAGFIRRMQTRMPLVRSKIAISMDGRTGMASGESQWITGPDARLDVQKLRAESSAILTGAGTVIADDCALTVRLDDWRAPYLPQEVEDNGLRAPKRVVLLGERSLPKNAKILQSPETTLLLGCAQRPDDLAAEVDYRQIPAAENGRPDLRAALAALGADEINDVLVEAGAELNGALLSAGLIDELYIYMAPKLLGSSARPLAALPIATMKDEIPLEILDVRQVGNDLRVHAKVITAQ